MEGRHSTKRTFRDRVPPSLRRGKDGHPRFFSFPLRVKNLMEKVEGYFRMVRKLPGEFMGEEISCKGRENLPSEESDSVVKGGLFLREIGSE